MSEQIPLRAGGYRASVDLTGAAIRSLSAEGVDLIPLWPDDEATPMYAGVVCAPWPNRVVDASYRYAGAGHRLTPTPAEPGHALHGLVTAAQWQITAAAADRVRLVTHVAQAPGWPFALDLAVAYAVGPEGLTARLLATNTGGDVLPYGCCPHPYLLAPVQHGDAGRTDGWTLQLPAATILMTDERLVPTSLVDVAGTGYDFRAGAVLGAASIDNAFSGLLPDADGRCRARISSGAPDTAGLATEVSWGSWARWVQVFSGDRPGSPVNRRAMAIEPMSCPPDAYNSGEDLVDLAPGDTHEAEWAFALVET